MKRIAVVYCLIIILLSACAGKATETGNTIAKTSQSTAQNSANKTAQVVDKTATFQSGSTSTINEPMQVTSVQSETPPVAECRTVKPTTPDPTVQALLPPPGEKDWVKGPDDARVTILDYSDFQ